MSATLEEKAQKNLQLLLQNSPVLESRTPPSANTVTSAPVADRVRKSSPVKQQSKSVQQAFEESQDFYPGTASGKLDASLIFENRSRSAILAGEKPPPTYDQMEKKPSDSIDLAFSIPYFDMAVRGVLAGLVSLGAYYVLRETGAFRAALRMMSSIQICQPEQQPQEPQQSPNHN